MNFKNPASLSIQGVARQDYEVVEPQVFKDAKTLKPLDKKTFPDGTPKLKGGLPSQISNPGQAKAVKDNTNVATNLTTFLSGSNVVVAIIVGGSMASFWGLIRAVQIITLSSLINIRVPTHLNIFLTAAVTFS